MKANIWTAEASSGPAQAFPVSGSRAMLIPVPAASRRAHRGVNVRVSGRYYCATAADEDISEDGEDAGSEHARPVA